ncbi:MAG TPA: O-antigen ligase family protein [Nitrospiraceae bacterium]|nr:O-antigen ligase family protein [Nitrospiraceae bacterium]
MFDRFNSGRSAMDRLGLICLGLLLLSPLLFKVRLIADVVVHPFTPLLFVAWGWTTWAALNAVWRGHQPVSVKWNILTPPVLLMGLVIIGLGCSLAINNLRSGSWQPAGWLLLMKWFLYLAPLPFTALLVIRNGSRVMKLLNIMIPTTALVTVVYSFVRFMQDPGTGFVHSRSESEPRYFVMGMFGEVLSNDGLVLRTDTVSQGAYGMYLALVVLFSIALALIRGLDAGLPWWYTRGQVFVVWPAAIPGILYTGSRTTLILLSGVVLTFMLVLLWRGAGVLKESHIAGFIIPLLLAVSASSWGISAYAPVSYTTLQRFHDTAEGRFELRRSALGTFSPLSTKEARTSSVRNVESRVWLWGKTVRYLMEHPLVLLTGLGNDRKRFLEEVIGFSYEGDHVHFQTAHNLFLDVLIKGGMVNLIILTISCICFIMLPLKAVKVEPSVQTKGLPGIGMMLLSFWPPFLLINLMGEEMFTDNLQLHWTILFGLLLGLLSISQSMSKSSRTEQALSS